MHDPTIGPRVAQFVAGDSPAHLERTCDPAAPCDTWIVNWEAAIVDKARARATTRAFLERAAGRMHGERLLRVNPLAGPEGERDAAALASWDPGWIDGVLLPRIESPDDVRAAAARLRPYAADGRAVRLHVLVETPAAALQAGPIAAALRETARAGGLYAGLADFTAAMGVWETADEPERNFAWFLGAVVVAAAAHGLYAVGPVPPGIDQDAGAWAATWRRMGYCGVMTVHPKQSAQALAAFVPPRARVDEALARLDALEASGGAAVKLAGRVVEVPMCVPDLAVLRYAARAGMVEPAHVERFARLFA